MAKTLLGPELSMVEFKKRSEIHWARKAWHILGVLTMAVVYAYTPLKVSLTALAISWILFVPIDFMRQRSPALNELMLHAFKPFMRDNEEHGIAGTTYLLTGVGIVTFIFPRDVVILTLLFLAFADPFASYFGIRYGKDKIFGHKSVQGSLAAFIICTVITAIYLYTHALLVDRILIVSLFAGLIGALAELIPLGKLDDNLTLPVLSGTFLWLLFTLFMFGAA